MPEQTNPYSEFGYYVHRVSQLLDKRGDEQFQKQLGISMRQFLLLRLIEADARHAPSQQAIADRLSIAKSAVSRHVDIARAKGWVAVKVSKTSRRQNALALTPKGRTLLAEAKVLMAQWEEIGFGDLSPADVQAALRALRGVLSKLNAAPLSGRQQHSRHE